MSASPSKPPYATESEQGLLTAVIAHNSFASSCDLVAQHPEWFSAGFRPIAEATFSLLSRGFSANIVTVVDELELRDELENLGGVGEVNARISTNGNFTEIDVRTYAEQIRRAAHDRRAFDWAQKIAAAAFSSPDELADLLERRGRDLASFGGESAESLQYRLMSTSETEGLEPSQGILGDLLFEDSIAILYAKSGRWKSFLALAMAFAIATDGLFFGRHARPGAVIYIAAEAARNLGKRITAARLHYGIAQDTPVHLYVLGKAVNLLDSSSVLRLIREVRAQLNEPLALVIIDTLARSMPGGDENATKDANTVFDAATAIREAYGCCVLIVHHDGKDASRGARGSSAIYANADTVLRITGQENKTAILPGDTLKLECEKSKEDSPFEPIAFTADVRRWATPDGQFKSSLVILPADQPVAQSTPLTTNQEHALEILSKSPGGLTYSMWKERCSLSPSSFSDARKVLTDRNLVRIGPNDNTYRLVASRSEAQNSHEARNQASGPEVRSWSETGPDRSVSPEVRIGPVPIGTPDHPDQLPGLTNFGLPGAS